MEPTNQIVDKEAAVLVAGETTESSGQAQGLSSTTSRDRDGAPSKGSSLAQSSSRTQQPPVDSTVSKVTATHDDEAAPAHDVAPGPETGSGKLADPLSRSSSKSRHLFKRKSSKGRRTQAGHPSAAVGSLSPAHTTASTEVSPSEATDKFAAAESTLPSSTWPLPPSTLSSLSPMSLSEQQHLPDHGETSELGKTAETPGAVAAAPASVSTCPSAATASAATSSAGTNSAVIASAVLKSKRQNGRPAAAASLTSAQEEPSKVADHPSPAGQVASPPVATDSPAVRCWGASVYCMSRA